MNVIQFITQYNARIKNKDFKDIDKINIIFEMIHNKRYLPVREKEQLVKDVILSIYSYDDMKNIKGNTFERDLMLVIKLINIYTTLNIDEKGYDLLCSNDLLEYVIGIFGKEYKIYLGILNTFVEDLNNKQLYLEDL